MTIYATLLNISIYISLLPLFGIATDKSVLICARSHKPNACTLKDYWAHFSNYGSVMYHSEKCPSFWHSWSSAMLSSATRWSVANIFKRHFCNELPSDIVQHTRRSKISTTTWWEPEILHFFILTEKAASEMTTQSTIHYYYLTINFRLSFLFVIFPMPHQLLRIHSNK